MKTKTYFLLSTFALAGVLLALAFVGVRRTDAVKAATLEYADLTEAENILNQGVVQNLLTCRALYYQFALEGDNGIFQQLQSQLEQTVDSANNAKFASFKYPKVLGEIDAVESSAGDLARFSRDYFSCLKNYRSIKSEGDKIFIACFVFMKNVELEGLFRITYNVKESILLQQLAFNNMLDNYTDVNIGVYEEAAEKTVYELAKWQKRIKDNLHLNRIVNEIQSFTSKIAATVRPVGMVVANMVATEAKLGNLMTELSGNIASIDKNIINPQQQSVREDIVLYSDNTDMIVLGIVSVGVSFLVGVYLLVNRKISAGVSGVEAILQAIISGKKTAVLQRWRSSRHELGGIAASLERIINDYAGMEDFFEFCNHQLLGGKRTVTVDSGVLSQTEKCDIMMLALEQQRLRQFAVVESIGREVGDLFLGMKNATPENERKAVRCISTINKLLNEFKDMERVITHKENRADRLRDIRPHPKPRPKLLESARFNTEMLAARG